ncbi:MAG TPA: pitrilysin family protein [Thermoanaerobaculia bacterium]|jgi:zinc protease|nr:pitrilysin family protein [Thermoanaerobaculia bacterium]
MSRLLKALPVLFLLSVPVSGQVEKASDLHYPPLSRFEIPRPQRVELENGLVVLLLEDHELPLVEVTAMVRAGSALDPAAKVGLAELAGEVLRTGGTETMSGDQLDDWLESRAAEVEVGVTPEAARVTLSSLKQDFPDALRVFSDVLRRPAFDAKKMEVERNKAVADVARQNDEMFDILFREFSKIIYGPDSPYGWSPTYATLGAIRRDDLVAWHRQGFHPDRTVIGVTGDISADEALRLVRQAFGDWPRSTSSGTGGTGAKPPAPTWRERVAPGVYVAEKNEFKQSGVMLGHLGVRRDDPDYYALELMNHILGTSYASRLFVNVRGKKGLAYTVNGQVASQWDHPGMATLFMSTKVNTTAAGIDALLEEARNIITSPPSQEEIERSRRALLDSFVFRVDSPRKVMNQALLLEFHGYPADWLARYRAGIEAVTPAQVRDAAARHLHPQDFAIFVVGPSEGRDRPLTDFGKVTPIDITLAEPPVSKPGNKR